MNLIVSHSAKPYFNALVVRLVFFNFEFRRKDEILIQPKSDSLRPFRELIYQEQILSRTVSNDALLYSIVGQSKINTSAVTLFFVRSSVICSGRSMV